MIPGVWSIIVLVLDAFLEHNYPTNEASSDLNCFLASSLSGETQIFSLFSLFFLLTVSIKIQIISAGYSPPDLANFKAIQLKQG